MFFILLFPPKVTSFHIWRLKCICILLLFTKKYGAEVCKFLDYMDSPSQTYMKWPLARVQRSGYFREYVSKYISYLMEFLTLNFADQSNNLFDKKQ